MNTGGGSQLKNIEVLAQEIFQQNISKMLSFCFETKTYLQPFHAVRPQGRAKERR